MKQNKNKIIIDVKKSGEGSPKAKISYNLEIKKGTL